MKLTHKIFIVFIIIFILLHICIILYIYRYFYKSCYIQSILAVQCSMQSQSVVYLKKATIYISLKIILLLKTFLNLSLRILRKETDVLLRLYLVLFSLGKNWKNEHSGLFNFFFLECLVRPRQQVPDIYILERILSFHTPIQKTLYYRKVGI